MTPARLESNFLSADLGKAITGDPSTLRFKIGDLSPKPFYETYGHHSVYLNVTLE